MVPTLSPAVAQPAPPAPAANRRGWLGVALQPITVPEAIVARAGQTSGRMVMSTTKGGPAELAGLRVGDVLLALNGTSASGPHALRAFLDSERIGSMVEVRLLRDGTVMTAQLTVAAQPG
jgi:S1-C subfamily serine protease